MKRDLVRFLASALVAPAPWAMSTACAIAHLVGRCHTSSHTAELVRMVKHTSALVQQVALKTIAEAGIQYMKNMETPTHRIPWPRSSRLIWSLQSITSSGCWLNQIEPVRAIESLATGSNADQLKVFIPEVLKFMMNSDAREWSDENCGCCSTMASNVQGRGLCDQSLWARLHPEGGRRLLAQHRLSSRDAANVPGGHSQETCQQVAVQHGILPLLFQFLQDWKIMMDDMRMRRVIIMLLAYPHQARTAFLQESQDRRTSAINHMIALQPGNPNAEELLELLVPGMLG